MMGGAYENLSTMLDSSGNAVPEAMANAAKSSFQNGSMLLRSKFPSLKDGWVKLDDGEFPNEKEPEKRSENVNNWKDYMEFRGLSPTSVAPFILHNVLSVFQMLKELGITSGKKLVYMLGAEIEMNMVPVFGELAFLLPDLDLTLVMISPSVKKICKQANDFPNSIISKGRREGINTYIYEFDPSHFGRVQIGLQPSIDLFHEEKENISCDAAVALNAGIVSYQTWIHTFALIVQHDIPFAASDHSISILHNLTEAAIPGYAQMYMPKFGLKRYETKLNPFHCPVTRDIGIMTLPNVNNGYLFICRGCET
jgi:hypothetical protein